MTSSRQMFFLSLALGSLITIIPLVLKLRRDPFDTAGSYAIWWIGFFVVSTLMGFREPSHAKRLAQGVGLGFSATLIESANLRSRGLIVGEKKGELFEWSWRLFMTMFQTFLAFSIRRA